MTVSSDWNFDQQCGSETPFEVRLTDPETNDPIDVTGASAEWIISKNNGTRDVNVLYYTTANGKLVAGGPAGTITGSLLPDDTLNIATIAAAIVCQHQMFVTLAGQQPVLIQQGQITFRRKLPVPT